MLTTLHILLGLCATLVAAMCGTPQPSENMKNLHAAYQGNETEAAGKLYSRQESLFTIDTYVYVIMAGQDGAVPETQILDQV
jgi:hypothetical protein